MNTEISVMLLVTIIVATTVQEVVKMLIPKIASAITTASKRAMKLIDIRKRLDFTLLIFELFISLAGLGVLVYFVLDSADIPATQSDCANMVLLGVWSIYMLLMFRLSLRDYQARYVQNSPITETATLSASLSEANYRKASDE